MQILKSKTDGSVNWVLPAAEGDGYFETRFVQRDPEYFVCYLSVQSGCSHGCRFCGLTTTKQTTPVDAHVEDIIAQARHGLSWGNAHAEEAETVHFNFMARGEPLASDVIHRKWNDLSEWLSRLSRRGYAQRPMFLISTILPKSLTGERLVDIFSDRYPELYYSLYSMEPAFRRLWMPQALPANEGLDMLAQWQQDTNKIPTIHFAFIKGHNDTYGSVFAICSAILARDLRVNVNIVRYNPPTEESEESDMVLNRTNDFVELLPYSRVRIIDRVGEDVYASCGMFPTADDLRSA